MTLSQCFGISGIVVGLCAAQITTGTFPALGGSQPLETPSTITDEGDELRTHWTLVGESIDGNLLGVLAAPEQFFESTAQFVVDWEEIGKSGIRPQDHPLRILDFRDLPKRTVIRALLNRAGLGVFRDDHGRWTISTEFKAAEKWRAGKTNASTLEWVDESGRLNADAFWMAGFFLSDLKQIRAEILLGLLSPDRGICADAMFVCQANPEHAAFSVKAITELRDRADSSLATLAEEALRAIANEAEAGER